MDPHDLANLKRWAGIPVSEDANMMMGSNDVNSSNPVKPAGENPWGISSPIGTTGANLDKRKIEREKNLVPGTDEWFRLWFTRDEHLTADDFEEQKPEDDERGTSLMSKQPNPEATAGSTNEAVDVSKKIAATKKKIDAMQNRLELARERRKMKGQRLQGTAEIKIGAQLSQLRQDLHALSVVTEDGEDIVKKRKKRQDVNHAIYVVTNVLTGEQYIGITAIRPNLKKALWVRMQKHVQRATAENKDWGLCKSIREYGAEAFTFGVLEIVRGKKPAHARELELVRMYNPSLNTFR
jgi:hypothetical protein